MPRAKTTKFYRTFSKGLITEAGYLTYPEDASSAELNTILSRKGNRSRRLGVDYEDGYEINFIRASDKVAMREFQWSSVNNDPNVTFTVLQCGNELHFFRMNSEPLSTQREEYQVNLLDYKIPTADAGTFGVEYCDMSAGSGLLFVAHRFMDPISIEYHPATNSLTAIPIVIQIRDFEGVYDGLANDEEPHELTAQHHYNLLNQGWGSPGTRSVDISRPSYPGAPATGGTPPVEGDVPVGGGEGYYDPYTGEPTTYEGGGGGGGWGTQPNIREL